MHNFHPATMAAIFTVPLNDDPVAEEGGWLVSTEQVCHPTSLMIKILLCSVSIHMECKYIHFYFFYPFREVYPHTSPPDFIITKFHVPSKSLATQPQPMNWYIPVITFLLPRKMNSQVPCWESCPLGGYFSSPQSFRNVPERGGCAAAVHFQGMPTHRTELSLHQSVPSLLFLCQRIIGNSPGDQGCSILESRAHQNRNSFLRAGSP